jgi:type II secretory pathway predicted ATPase ExeA
MEMHRIKALYGLIHNPFSQDVPTSSLHCTPRVEALCQRIESLVLDGGFAMVSGEPGTGKSAALRILEARLSQVRDLTIGIMTRPQSNLLDFYRELGVLFGVPLTASNRWGAFRMLREKWQAHIETTLLRPVLVIDEAQEMQSAVMSELRLIGSFALDSRQVLTVILAGDERLPEKLKAPDLHPILSRIRTKFRAERAGHDELLAILRTRLAAAGNPTLMTPTLMEALVDQCGGNCRSLLNAGDELLAEAARRELSQLDEKLLLDLTPSPEPRARKANRRP